MDMFDFQSKPLSSPLNYTGSKTNLFPQLEKLFPKDSEELWDVFAGGGSVFVNSIPIFKKIYVNDIITPLIQFYEFLQKKHWSEIPPLLNYRNIPKDDQNKFVELRKKFNSEKDFIDFFILCCSCTNNMMRFNKKFEFNQTWGKRNYNLATEERLCRYHERIYGNEKLVFLNKNFYELEITNPNAFVYLDPPYFFSMAGYNCYWSKEHEKKLFEFVCHLNSLGIKFMMSNIAEHKNVKNDMLTTYAQKFKVIELDFNYNKVSRTGKNETKEIIIVNY